MEELTLLGERAVQAKYELQRMTTEKKNEVLEAWNCKSDESRAG